MGVAEPAVTIMAASIPVMRMLFKELATGGHSYPSEENNRLTFKDNNSNNPSNICSKENNSTTIYSQGIRLSYMIRRNNNDKSIFFDSSGAAEDGKE
jgi:hypothetical protein